MAADRDVHAGAEALLVGDERGANVIWRAEIVLDGLPVIRVLGPRASGPPDVVVPRIGADVTVDTLLRYATARSVAQILRHDPGVRLGEDPEEVHQFRVATRRLRSGLRTFAPLLDQGPVSDLRGRLRLLGAKAGPRATPTS